MRTKKLCEPLFSLSTYLIGNNELTGSKGVDTYRTDFEINFHTKSFRIHLQCSYIINISGEDTHNRDPTHM